MRYFVELSYKGTHYYGWQKQTNKTTIQSVLNKHLSIILKENINLTGAGRTDTGVHAKFFVAHFDSNNNSIADDKNFIYKINKFLPSDIVIHKIYKVNSSAHSRFSAISRTYKYYITRKKDPFLIDTALYIYGKLKLKDMNQAAQILIKYKDYTNFCKYSKQMKHCLCNIYYSKWTNYKHLLVYTIKANRFLQNMVRRLVGIMLQIGTGKMNIKSFINILENKNSKFSVYTAPAHGLFLIDIEYPENIFHIN